MTCIYHAPPANNAVITKDIVLPARDARVFIAASECLSDVDGDDDEDVLGRTSKAGSTAVSVPLLPLTLTTTTTAHDPLTMDYSNLRETFKQQKKWSPEQEDALLEPFTYLCSVPGKEVRSHLIDAFNAWLKVPDDDLDAVRRIVRMLHNASLL